MGAADFFKGLPWKRWARRIGLGCGCFAVVLLAAFLVLGSGALSIVTSVSCGVNVDSNAKALVNGTFGGPVFTLDNMSVLPPPSLYSRLREELYDTWTHEASGYTYGFAGVHEAPMILYNGTKIDGNWENIPPAVKGVFWMRGNSVPEILATLQYGEWFPEERILLLPRAPFSGSWYGNPTAPSGASNFSSAYTLADAKALAESPGNTTVAVAFKACPEHDIHSGFSEDTLCETGSDDFTYAVMQGHIEGNLLTPSVLTSYETWTMEESAPAVERHSLWYRRVSLFCDKVADVFPHSYWLTKIIDEDGLRIEPYYSEYVDYMEGAAQIIWSGLGRGHHLV